MKIVVQRASRAQVWVDGVVVGALPAPGLVLLVGITHTDTTASAEKLAAKVWGLRVLANTEVPNPEAWSRGDMSASDIGAPLLAISQFTLYADTRKGRRPSWDAAAKAEVAKPLFDHFVTHLRTLGAHVETGEFGAMMEVELTNHGPVTMILES
ncbi:MAG: D-tyrosyl-tRNA(Tyr) deacylase [Propionibacteriaceae bacterium]|nr:D-tyrosyl-tRNA(Tyr) deacylase [Propionibacteriaceae bacterium]